MFKTWKSWKHSFKSSLVSKLTVLYSSAYTKPGRNPISLSVMGHLRVAQLEVKSRNPDIFVEVVSKLLISNHKAIAMTHYPTLTVL